MIRECAFAKRACDLLHPEIRRRTLDETISYDMCMCVCVWSDDLTIYDLHDDDYVLKSAQDESTTFDIELQLNRTLFSVLLKTIVQINQREAANAPVESN